MAIEAKDTWKLSSSVALSLVGAAEPCRSWLARVPTRGAVAGLSRGLGTRRLAREMLVTLGYSLALWRQRMSASGFAAATFDVDAHERETAIRIGTAPPSRAAPRVENGRYSSARSGPSGGRRRAPAPRCGAAPTAQLSGQPVSFNPANVFLVAS
jgi:hypothetical protein